MTERGHSLSIVTEYLLVLMCAWVTSERVLDSWRTRKNGVEEVFAFWAITKYGKWGFIPGVILSSVEIAIPSPDGTFSRPVYWYLTEFFTQLLRYTGTFFWLVLV